MAQLVERVLGIYTIRTRSRVQSSVEAFKMGEERVNTGGMMDIVYTGESKIEKEREDAIDEGYRKADARKRREKLFWIGVIILILGIGAYFLLR